MALILDTAGLPPERRAGAVAEVIRFSSSVPTRMVYNCPDDEVSARFEYFTFGETHLLKSENTSQGLVTRKGTESDLLTVSVKLAGTATLTQAPGRLLRDGDLFVTGLWRPFEFFDEGGENTAFYIPLARLGLARDYAMRAGELIHASPLAAQLRRHLEIVARDADALSQGPAAAMVGQATADLFRAALIAAVDEEPSRRDDWDQNLITVIKGYITEHLADPDLGAERIAQAMFISRGDPRLLGRILAAYGRGFDPRELLAYTLLHVHSNLLEYLSEFSAPPEPTLDSLALTWFGTA